MQPETNPPTIRAASDHLWLAAPWVKALWVTALWVTALWVTALCSCAGGALDWRADRAQQLKRYRQSFVAAAGSRLVQEVSRTELLERIQGATTLWLGDHHSHSRLHALHTELLLQLQQHGQPMALGLEAIGVRDERLVARFLADKISMNTLRDSMRTRWSGSWLDDRELDPWFFRSLLEFAKRYQIPVFALEPTPRLPLARRDDYMARSVAQARTQHPDRLLVVVVGQTHLLGQGNLAQAAGSPGQRAVVLGGLPTEPLLENHPRPIPRGSCWRADSGMLWFGEMFRE